MGITDIFRQQQDPYGPPTDQQVQDQIKQQYQDPLAAAQLSRAYDALGQDATGVAMITVENQKMIDQFKARMRGYIVKPTVNMETGEPGKPELVKFGEPVMSEEGINYLVGMMEMALTKSIMLSHIPIKNDKWILKNCQIFWRQVAVQIGLNSNDWRVDRKRRNTIAWELANLLYFNIMRAYDDGERRKLYPGQRNITTTMINPSTMQPEKRSMMSF